MVTLEVHLRSIIQHLIVAFLVVAIPIWDRYEVKRLKRSTSPRKRIECYQMTIAWLWAATIVLLISTPWDDLFRALPTPGFFVRRSMVLPVLVALGIGALLPLVIARLKPGAAPAPAQSLGD